MFRKISHIYPTLRNKEVLEKVYRESASMAEVAKKLGCGETLIHTWIHRLGIEPKSRPATQKGKKVSDKTRKKQSEQAKLRIGDKNSNWRNGATSKNMLLRGKQWHERRRTTLERDNYECVECGIDYNLHVHHILPVSEYPHLINDSENLITLCKTCHYKIHFPKNSANSVNPRTGNAELNSTQVDKCVETIHGIVGNN